MPFKSERQRRFLHANEPEIAERWEKKYGSKVVKSKPKSNPKKSRRA